MLAVVVLYMTPPNQNPPTGPQDLQHESVEKRLEEFWTSKKGGRWNSEAKEGWGDGGLSGGASTAG